MKSLEDLNGQSIVRKKLGKRTQLLSFEFSAEMPTVPKSASFLPVATRTYSSTVVNFRVFAEKVGTKTKSSFFFSDKPLNAVMLSDHMNVLKTQLSTLFVYLY